MDREHDRAARVAEDVLHRVAYVYDETACHRLDGRSLRGAREQEVGDKLIDLPDRRDRQRDGDADDDDERGAHLVHVGEFADDEQPQERRDVADDGVYGGVVPVHGIVQPHARAEEGGEEQKDLQDQQHAVAHGAAEPDRAGKGDQPEGEIAQKERRPRRFKPVHAVPHRHPCGGEQHQPRKNEIEDAQRRHRRPFAFVCPALFRNHTSLLLRAV